MDVIILSGIKRLPFYTVPYKFPNIFGSLSVTNPDSTANSVKVKKSKPQPPFSPKEYLAYILGNL